MQCLQSGKLDLRGETFDGFDQVLVAVPITGEELTHQRDKVEGILFVHPERSEVVNGDAVSLLRPGPMAVYACKSQTGGLGLTL
jgi:hypothetical protein